MYAAIVATEIKPGTALSEKALTRQFGVSRTPVREALIRLVEDGLVDIFPQSGTFVARIPVSAIPEALFVRQVLECATVERAAGSATPAALAPLDEILAQHRFFADRRDMDACYRLDDAFHEAIAAIAGYPGVWEFLKPTKVQIDRARRLALPALDLFQSLLDEHTMVRDAIAARDVAGASAAMKRHLNAVILDIKVLRESFPDYFV